MQRSRSSASLALWVLVAVSGASASCASAGDGPQRNPVGDSGTRDGGARDMALPGRDTGVPDPCATISCPPPQVCSGGRCVDAEADDDEDGYAASDDCDDRDPTVHPDAVETCDEKDNDCNLTIDDIAQTRTCMMSSTCGGEMECQGGVATCVTRDPMPETCNGEDDDCNGTPDDVSGDCSVGMGACARMGMRRCGMPDDCSVLPGLPVAETCNMTDDDCNGMVDDVPGGCGPPPECTPGAIEDLGGCGRCGTARRTCGADSRWGAMRCEGEGECMAGEERRGSCDDASGPCSRQICSASCRWGTECVLYAGNTCNHESGTNFRCCGAGRWQFCLPSCVWSTDCAACSGCGC
ncbi:MAG: putative metal-binding motif-containing protein [Deltaproteobacteria bacterium]|nr:putative metal-binding motif-containing protein [Deltaproteobacteria bacterium]